ncbi:hypothetical protein, partial [Rhodohalobacter sulfatireducens]
LPFQRIGIHSSFFAPPLDSNQAFSIPIASGFFVGFDNPRVAASLQSSALHAPSTRGYNTNHLAGLGVSGLRFNV